MIAVSLCCHSRRAQIDTLLITETPCISRYFDASIKPLRKFLSILLLAAFALPFLSPLLAFGSDGEVNLPACCRRAGKHHCAMTMAESQADAGTHLSTLAEKCPCPPAVVASVHSNTLASPVAERLFPAGVSHPSSVAQTESLRRVARDRSRQKRGPPARLLS